MIKFTVEDLISDEAATISLAADSADVFVPAKIAGDKPLVDFLKEYLESAPGIYGHLINLKSASGVDINAALLAEDFPYTASVSEGQDILDSYQLSIPEDAQT